MKIFYLFIFIILAGASAYSVEFKDIEKSYKKIFPDGTNVKEEKYAEKYYYPVFDKNLKQIGIIIFSEKRGYEGPIKLIVPVPVELFANKMYEIELICCFHYTGWVLAPGNESILRFEFFRDTDLNPYSNETRLGLLAPVLKWEVSKI